MSGQHYVHQNKSYPENCSRKPTVSKHHGIAKTLCVKFTTLSQVLPSTHLLKNAKRSLSSMTHFKVRLREELTYGRYRRKQCFGPLCKQLCITSLSSGFGWCRSADAPIQYQNVEFFALTRGQNSVLFTISDKQSITQSACVEPYY